MEAQRRPIQRGLVVVAHPDDPEYGCAGTIAAWIAEGLEVTYVIATDGGKGTADVAMTSQTLVRTRREEQIAAARVIGVKEVVFLDYPDGYIQHTLELRKDITRAIRQFRPDRLVTYSPYRALTMNAYINHIHPDHLAVGDATLAAVYPTARDRLMFPDLAEAGFEPHNVREVYVMGTETPDCWIDIAATIELKIQALQQHASQIGDLAAAEQHVRRRAAATASASNLGLEYAECFKLMRFS